MTHAATGISLPFGSRRRGVGVLAAVLVALALLPAFAAGSSSARSAVAKPQVALMHGHVARAGPSAHAGRIEFVAPRRPLTRVRTVLPVLAEATSRTGGTWLRVRLPGRPNGHSGWITAKRTKRSSTEWRILVDLSARRVTVYRADRVRRQFRAVVGSPATPTPRGRFFVEEGLALSAYASGGPYALATSARSRVLREFEGGPGQVAIHGTANLSGAPGSAVSHGCIRLRTRAITWMARRIGAGVPLTIVR